MQLLGHDLKAQKHGHFFACWKSEHGNHWDWGSHFRVQTSHLSRLTAHKEANRTLNTRELPPQPSITSVMTLDCCLVGGRAAKLEYNHSVSSDF